MAVHQRRARYISSEFTKFTENSMKTLAINTAEEIPVENPVDSGWSRNNYVPKIGIPFRGNATNDGNVRQAERRVAQGIKEVLLGYRLNRGAIFISNNVPYVYHLDQNHRNSKGFILRGIKRAIARTNRQLSVG